MSLHFCKDSQKSKHYFNVHKKCCLILQSPTSQVFFLQNEQLLFGMLQKNLPRFLRSRHRNYQNRLVAFLRLRADLTDIISRIHTELIGPPIF